MNSTDLQQALAITDGSVSIGPGTLTSNFDALLHRWYSNQPIVIHNAQPGPGNGQNDQVVIQGQAGWLNVDALPLTATFTLDASGNVQAQLDYTLIDTTRGTNPWVFSRSFPDLPDATDFAAPDPGFNPLSFDMDAIPLDQLLLYNTHLTVYSNWTALNRDSLQSGFFFTSQMTPSGALGILEATIGDATTLTLNGTIYIPAPDEITPPLQASQLPWTVTPVVPGISLQADLQIAPIAIGNLQFQPRNYVIYSPHAWQWYDQHLDYKPAFAYTGQFNIPSAGVQADVIAIVYQAMGAISISGLFQGISIRNLASLLDISGNNQLDGTMPAQMQDPLAKLESLELTQAGIIMSLGSGGFQVVQASFTVGFPNLDWQVWDSDLLKVNSVTAQFAINLPFTSPDLMIIVSGNFEVEGVPLAIQASNADGFTLYARLGEVTLPLADLMRDYLPGIPAPADLTINSVTASVVPRQAYSITATIAAQPKPWVIPVGPNQLTISNVFLYLSRSIDGTMGGNFSGTIAFNQDAYVSARYTVPGNFEIRGDFPHVSLAQLVSTLSNETVELPSGFDLTFLNSSILIQEQNGNFTFMFGTQVAGLGSFAFQAVEQGSQWGFAAGVALQTTPSQVNGLSVFKPLEDFLAASHLSQFVLIISSFDNAQFTFPEFQVFNNPLITGTNVPLPPNAGVIRGLNVYAQWLFNQSDRSQVAFLKLLGINTLSATVVMQLGGTPLGNEANLFLKVTTTLARQQFSGRFGVQYKNSNVTLFLDGTLQFTIDNKPYSFYIGAGVVANGIFVTGSLTGATAIDFGSFQLANVALFVGVDWEGIPSLGIAATIAAIGIQTSVALLFNANNPAQSIVAGSISGLTLRKIIDTFTSGSEGQELGAVLDQVRLEGMVPAVAVPDAVAGAASTLSQALDNLNFDVISTALAAQHITVPTDSTQRLLIVDQPGAHWFLTTLGNPVQHYELRKNDSNIMVQLDPQIYIVPEATQIGLMPFGAGFFLNGKLDVFSFSVGAMINVNQNQGIAADVQMSPIIIYNQDLLSVTSHTGPGGPMLSLATYRQPNQSQPAYQAPHLLVDGQVVFLGLSRGLLISITSDGFVFDLEGELFPLVTFDVHAHFNGLNNFGAGGHIMVGVKGVNIPISEHITITGDLNAQAELEVNYNGQDLTARLSFSYTVGPYSGQISAFDLDIHTGPLKDLPGLVVEQVKQHYLHADIDLHVDNMVQSHLDNPGSPRINTGGVHTDTPHTDQTSNHIDNTIKDWQGKPMSHTDTGGVHSDIQGVNQTTAHTDTPGTAHQDQAQQHQDQGYHVDNGVETTR